MPIPNPFFAVLTETRQRLRQERRERGLVAKATRIATGYVLKITGLFGAVVALSFTSSPRVNRYGREIRYWFPGEPYQS